MGSGDEVALSVEETNALRKSLGLPPLKMKSEVEKREKDEEDTRKRKRIEEGKQDGKELENRVLEARRRRQHEELLQQTETLGTAAEDVDDVMAWVNKTRKMEGTDRGNSSSERAALEQEPISRKCEESLVAPSGLKVKHSLEELQEGEEIIMTLEDKPIINEKGELQADEDVDALEHTLYKEVKQRQKSYAASKKTGKPLWEEDGQERSLLDKYDEEEEQELSLDDIIAKEAEKAKRQKEIKAKLEAVTAKMEEEDIHANTANKANMAPSGDYYTAEEMEAMESEQIPAIKKSKKRKGTRKLKKRALTEEDISALEMDAATQNDSQHLGSRSERAKRAANRTNEFKTGESAQRSRFSAALAKANAASASLREDQILEKPFVEDDEEGDFFASLNRAATIAAKKKAAEASLLSNAISAPEIIAGNLAKRREKEKNIPVNGGNGFTLSEIAEFARAIQPKNDQSERESLEVIPSAVVVEEKLEMQDNTKSDEHFEDRTKIVGDRTDENSSKKEIEDTFGQWIVEGEKRTGEKPENVKVSKNKTKNYRTKYAVDDGSDYNNDKESESASLVSVVGEKAVGRGMGSALAFLKDRGELNRSVEWAGRTTDSRDSYFTKAMGGFKDVYTGGSEEDKLARDVEIALTKKDQYGRILTPKEAWRQLCHDFHGNGPSRNTQEKRAKQIKKELAQRKSATGLAEKSVLTGFKAVQKQSAAPFVVLSGTVKPGQMREAGKGWTGGHG